MRWIYLYGRAGWGGKKWEIPKRKKKLREHMLAWHSSSIIGYLLLHWYQSPHNCRVFALYQTKNIKTISLESPKISDLYLERQAACYLESKKLI